MKSTEDLRAPLAFLMGRLDFGRDFGAFRSEPEGDVLRVTGIPKAAKSPYREVEFLLAHTGELRGVHVTGQDGGVMNFRFSEEQLRVALRDDLFQFRVPVGAELVVRQ